MKQVPTAELFSTLEPFLGRISRLDRRPSPYGSSFRLEELDVELAGGEVVRLVFKDLGQQALLEGARVAKPDFLYDPRREIETYRQVLAAADLGTARCYAAVCDAQAGRYWLFLERVCGAELYQFGELSVWQSAAQWLARFHARTAGEASQLASAAHLLRQDAAYYQLWPARARKIIMANPGISPAARDRFAALVGRYGRVIERLTAGPATVIHGEFYASNILVAGQRVCPIDWEMAAVAPALIDLAALTAGKWTDAERAAIVRSYRAAMPAGSAQADPSRDLDCCRLHLAVQWLGWSANWTPPAAHAHDWLAEALCLADKLGLV